MGNFLGGFEVLFSWHFVVPTQVFTIILGPVNEVFLLTWDTRWTLHQDLLGYCYLLFYYPWWYQ